MISILLPLIALTVGFLAAFLFRRHRRMALAGVAVIPPLLLSVYAFAKLGTYAWAGLLVALVLWCLFVALGAFVAKFAIGPS